MIWLPVLSAVLLLLALLTVLPGTFSDARAITPTLTLLPTTPTVPVSGTPDTSVLISAPVSGQVLFGVVRIVGSANSQQMAMYRLEFLAGADPQDKWQVIASQVTQQVSNNTLGQWDTSKVADGAYQIRLRVTLRNNNVIDSYARGLQVSNQQPTPLPTALLPPSATLPPTIGPSPTALIQQPPTATIAAIAPLVIDVTPSVSVNPAADVASTNAALVSDSTAQAIGLSSAAIQSALCSGGLLALLAFAAGGAFIFVRGRLGKR